MARDGKLKKPSLQKRRPAKRKGLRTKRQRAAEKLVAPPDLTPTPASPPAFIPAPEPTQERAHNLLRLLDALRWVQRHESDVKVAWKASKLLLAASVAVAGIWGFTQWQGEILGYRVRINKAPPDTGWEGKLRMESPKAGKDKP